MINTLKCAIAFLVFLISFSACNQRKSIPSDVETDTIPTFVKGDTIEVVNMASDYLDCIKKGKYEEAVSRLRYFENDTAKLYSDDVLKSIIRHHKNIPVLGYQLKDMTFVDAAHVRLTFSIKFMEAEQDSKIPNTVCFTFEPQRINAEWYLGLPEEVIRWGKVNKSSN